MSAPLPSPSVPDGPLVLDLALSGAGDAAPFLDLAGRLGHVPRTVRLGWDGEPEPLAALTRAFVDRGAEVELLLTDPSVDLEALFLAVKPLVGIPAIFLEARPALVERGELERNLRLGAQMALPMNLRLRLSSEAQARLDAVLDLSESAGAKRTVFWRDCSEVEGEQALLAELDRRSGEGYRLAVEGCLPACAHPRLRGRGCAGGFTSLRMDAEGRVFPCSGAAEPVGSAWQRPLEELWRSPALEDWRARLDPRCSGCALHPSCGSAGKARSSPDPLIRGPQALPQMPLERWASIDGGSRPYLTARREGARGAEIVHDARNVRHLVLVERRHDDLLDRLNGMHTREELEARFGEEGRALLQRLYLERLISFLPPAARV